MRNNNGFPSKAAVEMLWTIFQPGCRVELLSMDDPHTKLKPGDQGTVEFIDDTGTVFVNWDCGSSLGIVYGVDKIKRVQDKGTNDLEATGMSKEDNLADKLKKSITDNIDRFCKFLFGKYISDDILPVDVEVKLHVRINIG